jgi:hypothetical protein
MRAKATGAKASWVEVTGANASRAEATGAEALWVEVTEADVIGAEATGALLYLGSPNIFRVTEGHSFLRPLANLTSHLFPPLASMIVP